MLLAAVTAFHLVIMPTLEFGDLKTPQNADLFKPFDTGKSFESERACKIDAITNMQSYLKQRGLPAGTTANFACSTN